MLARGSATLDEELRLRMPFPHDGVVSESFERPVGIRAAGDASEASSGRCIRGVGVAGSGWTFVVLGLVMSSCASGRPREAAPGGRVRHRHAGRQKVAFELTLVPAGE